MVNGYVIVDCSGINLLSDTSIVVDGIYDQCIEAMESSKPIIASNCEYGEGVKCSPISVMGIKEDTTYIFTNSILQIRVSNDDTVSIVSLITPGESRKKSK